MLHKLIIGSSASLCNFKFQQHYTNCYGYRMLRVHIFDVGETTTQAVISN